MTDDEKWMAVALDAARDARGIGEVPVGAVLVGRDGELIASASNRTIVDSDPSAHAEILALRMAGRAVGNYRLPGTTMYSTIEPCAMCAGALVNARVSRLVFGAADQRFGAVATHFGICDSPLLNHRLEITAGILMDECRDVIRQFFFDRRKMKD